MAGVYRTPRRLSADRRSLPPHSEVRRSFSALPVLPFTAAATRICSHIGGVRHRYVAEWQLPGPASFARHGHRRHRRRREARRRPCKRRKRRRTRPFCRRLYAPPFTAAGPGHPRSVPLQCSPYPLPAAGLPRLRRPSRQHSLRFRLKSTNWAGGWRASMRCCIARFRRSCDRR